MNYVDGSDASPRKNNKQTFACVITPYIKMKVISVTAAPNQQVKYVPCVATIGFFDGVHLGHLDLIRQLCKEAHLMHLPATIITFPNHPLTVLRPGHHPQLLTTIEDKISLLEQAGVDMCYLIPFTQELSQLSAYDFMKHYLKEKWNVKRLIVGYDHHFGHSNSDKKDNYKIYGQALDIQITTASPCMLMGETISSSIIRKAILQGNVNKARTFLGRPYSLKGKVVHGLHNGHKLGFPTANILPENIQTIIPNNGSYAACTHVNHHTYQSMVGISNRPSIGHHLQRTIEVHIFDFQEDLYGSTLQVDFIEKIRDEKVFDSTTDLAAQLQNDAEQTRHLLNSIDS